MLAIISLKLAAFEIPKPVCGDGPNVQTAER